jgi:hypothetical protein
MAACSCACPIRPHIRANKWRPAFMTVLVNPVEKANSGHRNIRGLIVILSRLMRAFIAAMLAAMARPSRRFGGPRARCADKQGFPSWMRPGDRPPVQRSNNRPLMWNCCRQLKDRQGQLGGPSTFRRPRKSTPPLVWTERPGVLRKSQRFIQMRIVEDAPEQIYGFAMRPRMIAQHALDSSQSKRQKRVAAAV